MKVKNKFLILTIIVSLILNISLVSFAQPEYDLGLTCQSAVLMEANTGKILYQKNSHEKYLPASVTKVMTMLLIMEAIDSGRIKYNDMVSVSDFAASMGGSQVYLSPGEQMSVHDLLKAIAVASGNDASVALAEYIAGSEQGFIKLMNDKAKELGMKDTVFYNTTGLDDEEPANLTSANDIAIMSRELITKHPKVFEFTTIWIDSLRNGEFGLANTNKLIRFYSGANGLKTGSTSKAKFNLSATAIRNNLQLVATVMRAPTSKERFADAKKLLNYGFANYVSIPVAKKGDVIKDININKGVYRKINVVANEEINILVKKGEQSQIEPELRVPESYPAPFKKGQKLGELIYSVGGKEIARYDLVSQIEVKKINVYNAFTRILSAWVNI